MVLESFLKSKIKNEQTRLLVILISFNLIMILANFCQMTLGRAVFFELLMPLYSMAIKPVFNLLNKEKDEILSMEKLEQFVTVSKSFSFIYVDFLVFNWIILYFIKNICNDFYCFASKYCCNCG